MPMSPTDVLSFRGAAAAVVLAAAGGAEAASAGPLRVFGDWSVACDNTLACTAIGLGPRGSGGSPYVRLTRTAGPNPVTTAVIDGVDGLSGRSLAADGKDVVFPPLDAQTDRVLDEAALRTFLDGLAGSSRLGWTKPPTQEDSVSLKGMNEALRHIDERQGRVGTTSALVARGRADEVSPAPAHPMLRLPTVPESDEVEGGAAAREVAAFHRRNLDRFDCDSDLARGDPPSSGRRLGGKRVLFEVSCSRAAYQSSVMVYVHDAAAPAGRRVSPAPIEDLDDRGRPRSDGKPRALLEADYTRGVIESHAKGRGVGDCYEHSTWLWDGRVFRLAYRSLAPHCGYSRARYVLWRAAMKAADGTVTGLDPSKDPDTVE